MIVLVTTAGKTGTEAAQALLAAGHTVCVGARDPARVAIPGAQPVAFDYAEPTTVASALAGVDALFSPAPPWLLPEAEARLAAAAKTASVRRFVKLSGMGVDQDPTSLHRRAELAVEGSGMAWTHLRANFFMQNYATTSADGIRRGALHEPAADGATSFVDTRDVGACVSAVLADESHAGRAYTLTGPAALTRAEVAAILSAVMGRLVAYVPVDDAALRGAMAGAPPGLVELMSTLMGYVRAGYTGIVSEDVAHLLGRPATDFATFAHDHRAVWA